MPLSEFVERTAGQRRWPVPAGSALAAAHALRQPLWV